MGMRRMWERDQRDMEDMSSGIGNGKEEGNSESEGKWEDGGRGHILGGMRAIIRKRARQESGTKL